MFVVWIVIACFGAGFVITEALWRLSIYLDEKEEEKQHV